MAQGRIYNLLRAGVAIAALCALATGGMQAGEYHSSESSCSDCHASHASVRGVAWTPAEHLLKNAAGQVALCLSCHDGTEPQAPDIVAAGTAANPSDIVTTQYTSKYGSSAGFFQSDYLSSANPCGHGLTPTALITPPLSNSYSKPGGLVCSDCHDPHGNNNYRNLRPDPNPSHPGSFAIIIGTHVQESIRVNAQSPNPAVAYDTNNISFNVPNNIGGWCSDCHDKLAANESGSAPAHFKGHPSDVPIGATGTNTDLANWSSQGGQLNTGFGTDVGDATAGIPRVRFGSPSGSSSIAGVGSTVSCLSCHKAHGSKYKYGMVWPAHQAGPDMLSGCQQCHFK